MSGGDHGAQGAYPDDWDRDARERVDVDDDPDAGGSNPDLEGADLDADDLDDDDELEELQIDDEPDDAREYNCGDCGQELEYLGGDDLDEGGKGCPGCGERLFWSQVAR